MWTGLGSNPGLCGAGMACCSQFGALCTVTELQRHLSLQGLTAYGNDGHFRQWPWWHGRGLGPGWQNALSAGSTRLAARVSLGVLYAVKKYALRVHRPPSVHLWPSSSNRTVCPIFMELRLEVFYKTSNKHELHGNRLKVSSGKGVNDAVTNLPHFLTDFLEIRYRFPHNCVER